MRRKHNVRIAVAVHVYGAQMSDKTDDGTTDRSLGRESIVLAKTIYVRAIERVPVCARRLLTVRKTRVGSKYGATREHSESPRNVHESRFNSFFFSFFFFVRVKYISQRVFTRFVPCASVF